MGLLLFPFVTPQIEFFVLQEALEGVAEVYFGDLLVNKLDLLVQETRFLLTRELSQFLPSQLLPSPFSPQFRRLYLLLTET